MSLRADVTEVAGNGVVILTGAVDLATVPILQNALASVLVDRAGETIAVDLDGVDSLDDVGLGVLLGAAGRARRHAGDLIVVCSSETLRQQFTLTGLDRAIIVTERLP